MLINNQSKYDDIIYKEEAYQIVGAAMEVYYHLGCGFLEAIYQEALEIEFSDRHIPFIPQKRITVAYKDRLLSKEYITDFLCYDKIIIEIKAIKTITEIDESQILNSLKATELPLGILINFGGKAFDTRRYANTKNTNQFKNREKR